MSIQSQINRIKANVAAAYTAAQSKGATMPSSQNSANLAATINSISANQAVDYVVEQRMASGNSWGYRKWNSGLAECWCSYTISAKSCSTAVGSWYRTAEIKLNAYPFTFTATPSVNTFFETATGTGGLVWTAGTSTDVNDKAQPHQFYIIRMTSSTSVSGKVHAHAVGRWK